MPEYFEGTWDKDCELLSNYCLDKWLVLPEQPIMHGYFQFVYLTNRSVNEFKINAEPDFVCFDTQKCPILLSEIVPIEIIDGLTCGHIFDLIKVNDVIKDVNSYLFYKIKIIPLVILVK